MLNKPYGAFIRRMRTITNIALNEEPKWHHNGPALTSGYNPRWRPNGSRPTKTKARG